MSEEFNLQEFVSEVFKGVSLLDSSILDVKLWPIDQRIIREMGKKSEVNIRELIHSIGKDESFVYKRINHLRRNGLVEKTDWGKYRLTPLGDEVSKILREVNSSISIALRDLFSRKQD